MAKDKKSIELELSQIQSDIIALDSQISQAEAAGDERARISLMEDLATLDAYAKGLEIDFSKIQEQELGARRRVELESKLAQPTQTGVQPERVFQNFTPVGPMGGMLNIATTVSPPPTEMQKEESRQMAGELLNAPVGEGGRKAEMLPAGLRAKLGSLPTPESRAQLLQQNFPGAYIAPLNLRGNTEFLIKMPDGTVKTTFESGLAGFAGTAAVEAILTPAQLAAGLGTTALTKSPALGLGASAGTRLGLGTAIDEALRFGYGIEQNVGESLGRRGTEAAIELAVGGVSDVAIPALRAARTPSPFANEFANNLERSATRLSAREAQLAATQGRAPGTIQVPAGARLAGPEGLLAQQELAGEFPQSGIAASARQTQETMRRLFEDFTAGVPATPNDFSAIAVNRAQQREQLANGIAASTKSNKRVIQEAIDRQFVGRESNVDELGDTLRNSILAAEEAANKARNEAYSEVFDLADSAGFQTTPSEMLDAVSQIKRDLNRSGAADTGAIKGVEARLIERREAPKKLEEAIEKFQKNPSQDLELEIRRLGDLSRPMTSRDFDDYIKAFRDARPEGGAIGGSTKDVFGAGIASRLSDYRMQRYSDLNLPSETGEVVNVGERFAQAAGKVAQRAAFEKNLLGNILKEAGGEQATSPRNIVSAVMREPATINRVTAALRQLGESNPAMASEADRVLGLMQTQYMNDIGIGNPSVGAKTRVPIDTGKIEALFGKEASSVKRALDEVNKNLRGAKSVNVSQLTFNDIKQLGGLLAEDERKKVAKNIFKRLTLEKEQQSLLNSQLFKLAQKGDFKNIDPDLLSKAILSEGSTLSQVKTSMGQLSKLSPESRNLYKGDFIRELLDRFPGGDPTANAPFTPLFDAKKFISAYEAPGKTGKTQFAAKLETILGKQDAQFLYDLAKTYDANALVDLSKKADARLIAGREGVSVYLTTGLASKARNRMLAAMLSSGSKRHGLKSALSRNALPGAVNDAYNQMFREAFLTRSGMTSLAHQASQDPEFSAELTNMANDFKTKQGLVTPEFIRKNPNE